MFTLLAFFVWIIFAYLLEYELFNLVYLKDFWFRSFDFKGTSTRKDFWIAEAWLLLISPFVMLMGFTFFLDGGGFDNDKDLTLYLITPLYLLGIISSIPNLSIQVRRLRDAARNPWWILISFVPFIGGIVLLIFYLSPSRKKRLPMTLQDRLSEVEDLLKKGTIDEEEYKCMRKKILTKYVD